MPSPVTAVAPGEWTADLVRQLPEDGNRYEVIDGELLVSPSPRLRHQRVCVELWRLLDDHVRAHGVGIAACAPADIEYSPRRMVQPDVFVVPFANGRVPKGWDRMPRLLLVAEVSSPSTARYDRKVKRRMYQDEKVPEYWVVQPHASLIERWTPGDVQPAIHDEVLVWRPTPEVAALTIDVAAFFDGIHSLFEDDAGW